MNNHFTDHRTRLTHYQRYVTRVVQIGKVPLGGKHPIRIQSMTNTDTMNTAATVQQTIRLVEAGCDYVRITAPSVKEAKNLGVIKAELANRGYQIPLIADIHFVPRAAEIAARLVEKVRVNPGNYVDRKRFQQLEYTPSEYDAELERIAERFTPLVRLCRENGTAMRIGSNHGSLSDRILSHYGDTPQGMVESALEFVRICAAEHYHELVISMKASNTRVMIQAYRLLVDRMEQEGMNYPLHLGVTEAGDGDDARLKSALGIGSLLMEGLGDTIRVSLTEAPEAEVPVARQLVRSVANLEHHSPITPLKTLPFNPFEYHRRPSNELTSLGGQYPPVVIADLTDTTRTVETRLQAAGYRYDPPTESWQPGDQAADILYYGATTLQPEHPAHATILIDAQIWPTLAPHERLCPLYTLTEYRAATMRHPIMNFVHVSSATPIDELPDDNHIVWVVNSEHASRLAELRRFILGLVETDRTQPVILAADYADVTREALILAGAAELGALLTDGLADGIWLAADRLESNDLNSLAFGILQASRSRMTKTEYIACPSCGRTLFDLEAVTAQIRDRTRHLKGVKIGIMGCIVNGPGEMADADFGFVGTGPERISLYRGQQVIKQQVPQAEAVDSLIDLIKSAGYWVDP